MLQGPDKLNADIKQWAAGDIAGQKAQFAALDIRHRDNSPSPRPSIDQLKAAFRSRGGMISRISFKFTQNMVFVAKGVGKGVPISKAGTSATKRKPKDWFNKVMDDNIDALADIVANNQADMIINNLHIR